LKLLESALGALNPRQSPENLKAQLSKIKDSIARWQKAAGQSASPMQPAPSHGAPAGDDLDALIERLRKPKGE
jgi:hypothetical protein